MKNLILILLTILLLGIFQEANAQEGGYATVRVFDCNKSVGLGSG